jgi:D-arabinose 1-dehydrogenase-like Zn-dependent alcohol dehydrogenase
MTRLKWKLVSVHLEIVLILTQDGCTVCAECTTGSEIVCTHPMELLGDVGHIKSRFGQFGDRVSVSARQVHSLRQM